MIKQETVLLVDNGHSCFWFYVLLQKQDIRTSTYFKDNGDSCFVSGAIGVVI